MECELKGKKGDIMKNKKIFLLLAFCIGMVVTLTSCGAPYSEVDLKESIKVGEYKGLKVEKYDATVSDKAVNEQIKKTLESKATTKQIKSGTVKKGDSVMISYEGKINGKKFDGGSAEGQNLVIGSGQYIDGFESGLIGANVGDTKTLKLKFPKKYNDSKVAGKDVIFKVKIDSLQKVETPELNEDFVKKNTKFKTVDEYKASVKKELKKQNEESGIETQKAYLWNQIVSTSSIKKDKDGKSQYPDKELTRVSDTLRKQYESLAKQNNMKFKDFIKQQMGVDEKAFDKQLSSYAKTVVKEDLIAYYIADKEKIKVSDKEYKAFIEKNLKKYGFTEESYKKATGKSYEETYGGKDNIMTQVYRDKVLDFVLKNAKVVDKIKK